MSPVCVLSCVLGAIKNAHIILVIYYAADSDLRMHIFSLEFSTVSSYSSYVKSRLQSLMDDESQSLMFQLSIALLRHTASRCVIFLHIVAAALLVQYADLSVYSCIEFPVLWLSQ